MRRLFFATLFKKYRLRSEFETLSEFGNTLAMEGIPYESSLFSRWQKGERIPRDRRLFITMIKIFVKRNGITSLKEANQFLESTGQGYLTEKELQVLPQLVNKSSPFQAPKEIDHFTGRENYIKSVKKNLVKGGVVLIHGPAGIGKTSLAIKLSHMVRHEYPDGVLWYRVDTSRLMDILASIAYTFGENINGIKDIYNRASYVRSLLAPKKVLLVFDNVEFSTKLSLLIPNSPLSSILLTSRYKSFSSIPSDKIVSLQVFQEKESLKLFKTTLGKKFLNKNKDKLLELTRVLDNLPLAISIFAKQLLNSKQSISQLLFQLKKEKLKLEEFNYEDTNLLSSLKISFQNLNQELKTIFISLGIFDGPDFSSQAVAYVNKLSLRDAKGLLEQLVNHSLISHSFSTRFRLHPVIKIYVREKTVGSHLYEKAAGFYVNFMAKTRLKNLSFHPFIRYELDNIYYILAKCLQLKKPRSALTVSKDFFPILWEIGHWDNLKLLSMKVYNLSSKYNYHRDKVRCCVRELSWVYYWTGNIAMAERYTKEGLLLAKKINDEYLTYYAQERMGKIFATKGDYRLAIEVLNRSFSYFSKVNNHERMANILRYLGETYMWLQQFEQATTFLNQSQKELDKLLSLQFDYVYRNINFAHQGIIQLLSKNLNGAKELFEKSIQVEKIVGSITGPGIWSSLGLGLIYEFSNQIFEAREYFKKAKKRQSLLGIEKNMEKISVDYFLLKQMLSKSKVYHSIGPN
ncbi:hypothetical protein HY357_04010 [Candidatus Roizmanbacteria bacterium]|nr:hypothetical protein [Candidatus Roizmanbacteria bacterium]